MQIILLTFAANEREWKDPKQEDIDKFPLELLKYAIPSVSHNERTYLHMCVEKDGKNTSKNWKEEAKWAISLGADPFFHPNSKFSKSAYGMKQE